MNEVALLISNFFSLFVESAPWLLLGLVIAGIMHELLPVKLLERHMGSRSTSAIIKASLIGAPLPLCSCGVIPAALGLRRSGASRPATSAFLVATPETGVDSISVSYALLGPVFAFVRPFAAIVSAIYTGLLVKLFTRNEHHQAEAEQSSSATSCCATTTSEAVQTSCCSKQSVDVVTQPAAPAACCASTKPKAEPDFCAAAPAKTSSCCSSDSQPQSSQAWLSKIIAMLTFSFTTLLKDIVLWLMIRLGLAAMIQTFVPMDFLTRWGDGLLAMLVMALIGVPMYICATASTPVALGFLAAGLSPGAVLVFLLAGPATNISTMGMIGKEMGARTLVAYLFGVVSAAIMLGYGLNLALEYLGIALDYSEVSQHHHGTESPIHLLAALILFGLIVRTLTNGWRAARPQPSSSCH